MENLAPQAETLRSARQFLGQKPIAVTPITLKGRPNIDSRQWSLFGAAWTAGSLKHLAEGGAASVTYYETHGPLGIMANDRTLYPVFQVLAKVGAFAGGEVYPAEARNPDHAAALVLKKGGRRLTVLANLTARPLQAILASNRSVQRVSLSGLVDEARRPSSLGPYEVWFLEG